MKGASAFPGADSERPWASGEYLQSLRAEISELERRIRADQENPTKRPRWRAPTSGDGAPPDDEILLGGEAWL